MADIRIKDLAVTASASSSDDYLAVDGSTNGTRKLSAYSPTFGGNLTVSGGTATINGGAGAINTLTLGGNATSDAARVRMLVPSTKYNWQIGAQQNVDNGFEITPSTAVGGTTFSSPAIQIAAATGNTTINYGLSVAGNLTVSGTGASSVAGNLLIGTITDGGQKLQVNGTAAISGALSIGNTVQTAVSVASTHKVTISIGGSTYYLLATNV